MSERETRFVIRKTIFLTLWLSLFSLLSGFHSPVQSSPLTCSVTNKNNAPKMSFWRRIKRSFLSVKYLQEKCSFEFTLQLPRHLDKYIFISIDIRSINMYILSIKANVLFFFSLFLFIISSANIPLFVRRKIHYLTM